MSSFSSFNKCFFSFLRSCDIFGESFSFKINKQRSYTSVIGGALSLAFLIYSFYYLWLNLFNFFSKNVRITIMDDHTVPESYLDFKDHNYFAMAFCIRDESRKADNYLSSMLTMSSFLLNRRPIGLITETCTEDYFQTTMKEIYQQDSFEGCRCMNFTKQSELNELNVQLKSKTNINQKDYLYFQYHLREGSNTDEFVQSIKRSRSKMHIYFPSYEMDINNKLPDPFRMNVETLVFDIKPYTELKSEVIFSVLNFTDYNSLIDEDYFSKESKISIENFNQIAFYNPDIYKDNDPIFQMKVSLSLHSTNFNRRIMKYDDFLDDMVGYLSDMVVLLYVFNMIYNSFGARVHFAEKFFFKNEKFQREVLTELHKKIDKPLDRKLFDDEDLMMTPTVMPAEKNVFVKCIDEPNTSNKDNIEHKSEKLGTIPNSSVRMFNLPKEIKTKRNNFEFNFYEYFLYLCCFYRSHRVVRKLKCLDSSSNFCDYYLDVNNYVKKMVELDLIKILLMEDKPNEMKLIQNIRPFLKESYTVQYSSEINKLYLKNFDLIEQTEIVDNIKNLHTTNKMFYESLISLS